VNSTKKTLISVAAVAALGGAGLAAPQLVSAANSDSPSSSSPGEFESGDDHGRHSGRDTPHDRAGRHVGNDRHFEPGDDHGDDDQSGPSGGGDDDNSGSGGDSSGGDD
jgi:hypothetical protein